MKLFFLDPG